MRLDPYLRAILALAAAETMAKMSGAPQTLATDTARARLGSAYDHSAAEKCRAERARRKAEAFAQRQPKGRQ